MSEPASKLCTLADVVSRQLHSGDSVVVGTALESLIPFAAGYELIRQGIR